MAQRNNENTVSDEALATNLENKSIVDVFEDNKDTITYILIGLFIVVGGYILYRQMFKMPKEKEAIEQMVQAQTQFERDSFAVALTNPGQDYPGFVDIADTYSGTAAGNLALYYAGISYLNLGQFEAAIDYLKDFSPTGDITPSMRAGALGDAYSETNDMGQAMSYYQKAVSSSSNDLISAYYLKKVGMLHEQQGDKAAAAKAYQTIKDQYFDVPLARDIDKYLVRVAE